MSPPIFIVEENIAKYCITATLKRGPWAKYKFPQTAFYIKDMDATSLDEHYEMMPGYNKMYSISQELLGDVESNLYLMLNLFSDIIELDPEAWQVIKNAVFPAAQIEPPKWNVYKPGAAKDYVPNPSSGLAASASDLPGIYTKVSHPVENTRKSLHAVIMSLNDVHKWTREQIADWLESIHDPTGINGPNLNFEVKDKNADNKN